MSKKIDFYLALGFIIMVISAFLFSLYMSNNYVTKKCVNNIEYIFIERHGEYTIFPNINFQGEYTPCKGDNNE
jgi:hypothetical protein